MDLFKQFSDESLFISCIKIRRKETDGRLLKVEFSHYKRLKIPVFDQEHDESNPENAMIFKD